MKAAWLVTSLLTLQTACNGLQLDPAFVHFADRRYDVRTLETVDGGFELSSPGETVRLDARPLDARHIVACPSPVLMSHDFDGDERADVGFYSCGWLSIYIDSGKPLGKVEPISIEYRAGRWAGMARWHYPGLADLDRRLMRRLDPDAW